MTLSNYPPNVSGNEPIFGTHDHNILYTAYITIYGSKSITHNTIPPHDQLINHTITTVNQRYISVTPDLNTFTEDHIELDEYINYHFEATIISDITYDCSYLDPEDDTDLIDDIKDDIKTKLSSYGINDIKINEVEYEV